MTTYKEDRANKKELHVKITVQAYADDVLFVSESDGGITEMLQVLDRLVEWARMEINVSMYATMSYIYDENKR
jgi:hypothetical protein